MRVSVLILATLLSACRPPVSATQVSGDAAAGARDLGTLGCASCHTIPGIAGAHGKVGPSLQGLAERSYIAGQLPNQVVNLEHWIRDPHSVHPETLMPQLGVSEIQARDIAAYFYSEKR